jgi:tetratricopeptide (TPR) repeat protein
MDKPTGFVSYSHDSDEHKQRVLALSERLRQDGIETLLDQYVNGTPTQGWPRWTLDQLDAATHVLVICSENCYRRFRGLDAPGKGKGTDWQGALITQELYESQSRNAKFVPVFMSPAVEKWIPEPLRSVSHYAMTSEADYQNLYDYLLGQAGVEPRPLGALKPTPRRPGDPLTFGPSSTGVAPPIDISRIDKYAPAELIGREAETLILAEAWAKAERGETKRPRILTFVALGGEGKTSLVAKWVADLAGQNWPGCEAAFAWSFYSQGSQDQAASSDLFLREALLFFGDPEMANSAQGPYDKGRRLAQLVGVRRALVILDGLEPLQYGPTAPTAGELKDQGVSALLKGLAASSAGLCVVTSRYSIPNLKAYWQTTAPEIELKRLSTKAGVALLFLLGVKGTQAEFDKLIEDVRGHALTLNLLGTYLRDAHAGDIRKRDRVKLAEADAEEQGGHAFQVMDAYARTLQAEGEKGQRALALLSLLGLFDRPASADCLEALWKAPAIPGLTESLVGLSDAQRNIALTRLEAARLLSVNRETSGALVALDAHPLLREYFARRLREGHPEAWRAAHKRVYEHLCATTEDKPDAVLEDLQPLYQAIVHGCHAGCQQGACDEVYYSRLHRKREAYSTFKLGAVGSDLAAISSFFESPWDRTSSNLSDGTRVWLLNEAATRLRALGRLFEALNPMRAGLQRYLAWQQWDYAAGMASNLSGLELSLGRIAEAIQHAAKSVTYADTSGVAFWRMGARSIYAFALHNAGRRTEAEASFREAEALQSAFRPANPQLYSVQGFRYCDLLFSVAERQAWIATMKSVQITPSPALEACKGISLRATASLRIAEANNWLLDIALDNLSLGRAEFITGVLEETGPPVSAGNTRRVGQSKIEEAVVGIRRSGDITSLPIGLLSRSWQRFLEGNRNGHESAQADLDEAWEIAELGPMPLFMADIHLHRARLLFREPRYPWVSPRHDLAEARRLIEKHGYWRRKEELDDAEAAILNGTNADKQ